MPEPTWLTGFLDVPGERFDAAVEFWSKVTGTTSSPVRHGTFVTLEPSGGDGCWRVQRLDAGVAGMHLDLHTDGREELVADVRTGGAALVDELDDVTVLRSPGGLAFCVVGGQEVRRPDPVRWPAHVSMLDQVCLDVPSSAWEVELSFWAGLVGEDPSASTRRSEFTNLPRPNRLPLRLLFQRVGHDGPVTAHPDLASTDRPAEVARLEDLGAVVETVEEFWTVLVAPDGRRFCVTERDPGTGHLN